MAHAPQASLYVVGFDPVVTHGAFALLSAVLMLGNIQFTTTETGKAGDLSELKVTNGKETLPWLAKCFQLEEAAIVRALTWRTTTTRGENFSTPLTLDKVRGERGAIEHERCRGIAMDADHTSDHTSVVGRSHKGERDPGCAGQSHL